jgi:cation-transporting ATPase E
MTRVGSIFFVKTIYSFFLSIICALSVFFFDHAVVFPFIAIQITVIDQILEGYPTFFMSFEADKTKVSDTFLRTSLLRALPQAIMVTVALSVLYVVTSVENWPALETSALMYHALGVIMIIAVFKACQPFKPLRLFLFTTSAIGFFLSAFILGQWFSDFIHFGTLSIRAAGLLAITTLICVALRAAFSYLQKHGKRHGRGHKGKRLI